MHAVITCKITVVHVAGHDTPIDPYILEIVIHINIIDVNIGARPRNPAMPIRPSVIVNAMMFPVEVIVQPDADREARSEGDHRSAKHTAVFEVHQPRIVRRHVTGLPLRRPDLYVAIFDFHILLRCGFEVPSIARFLPQALYRCHHILGLVHIGLP